MLLLTAAAACAQVSLPDSSVPRVIVPAQSTPQFLVLNADASLQGYATSSTSPYTLNCGAPQGVSVAAGTSLTLAVDDRSLTSFQTGWSTLGPAAVGRSTPSNGSNCQNSPSVLIGGGAATALLATEDHFHQRLYVVSQGTPSSADTITAFSTADVVFNSNSNTLTQAGQAALDTGGTYTSVVTDVDGTFGDTIVTELRTSTSAGGLWLFNSTTATAIRILGPGGVALPAIGAFILHNPNNGGGGLLVLANQDGLTSSNLASPPTDNAPFSIIDLGQLDSLIAYHSGATSITLPSMTTIGSSLGYYAMLGAAYNPVTRLLYAVVGGGTSSSNVYREIVSYDPSKPAAPAETIVADVSAAQLTSSANVQVALNAAAGTMQILGKDTNTVYTAAITGTGNTGTQVTGSTFSDANFTPTYIASNPLLGETYIASKSQVDIITKPTANKIQLTLDLTGPETQPAVGNYSANLLVTSPNPVDFGLSSTSVTVTATPQGGTPYTFGSVPAAYGTGSPTIITGNFPSAGIYTLVASFPGDTVTAAATSSPVVVAVGQALFPTQTSVTGTFNSSTGAGNATVSLTGTTYTPSGTITLTSVNTGSTLVTYTLQAQAFSNPSTFAFTAPPSTTQIKATYSGDSLNQASASAATTLTTSQATVTPKLTLTLPATGATNSKVHLNVAFASTSTATPTGTIVVSAATSATAFMTIANISAAQAFAAGGAGYDWTPAVAGQYFFTLYYDGDSNYGLASVSNAGSITITSGASTTPTVSVSPTSATFLAAVGSTSAYQSFVVTNTSSTSLTINTVITTGIGFAQSSGCSSSLAAGASCTIRVNFSPTATGTVTGAVTITDNATDSPQTVALTGTAVAPLTVAASATSFIDQTIGTSSVARPTVTITNNTLSAITLSSITLDNTTDFDLDTTACGMTLAAGANCNLSVTFHPGIAGAKTGTVTVSSSASVPLTVTFTGNGLAPGACADSDGDSLCDDWETHGVWVRVAGQPDQFVDLPAMGANPFHKDIFLQIDWMATDPTLQTGAHSHEPMSAALLTDVKAYAAAPLTNPDGVTGINLHIDCGQTCYTGQGGIFGSIAKGKQIAEVAVLDPSLHQDTVPLSWAVYDQLSSDFNLSGRKLLFHHVIYGHDQNPGYTSSGISRNSPNPLLFHLGASDLAVTLGSWPNQVGTVMEQAGTLMHELGHNLSLHHGGQDDYNRKPNYLSIMNYNFQMHGLVTFGHGGLLDYSEDQLPTLDETMLDEIKGLNVPPASFPAVGPFPAIANAGTGYFCPGDDLSKVGPLYIGNLNGNINWNCNPTGVLPYPVEAIVNGENVYRQFFGYQDWTMLRFHGGAIAAYGSDNPIPDGSTSDDVSQEQDSLFKPLDGVVITAPSVLQTAPGTTVGVRFVVANTGQASDTYTLTAASQEGWMNTTVSPATLTLAAGAQAEVMVTYTVPATAAAGAGDRLTLSAQSQNAPHIMDAAQLFAYATATPAPLSVSAAKVMFGTVTMGATSTVGTVALVNTGTSALSFPAITASAEFAQTNNCPQSLAAGASCNVSLTFTPAAPGVRSGTLSITSSASSAPLTIALNGTSVTPQLARPGVALTSTPAAPFTGQPVTLAASVVAGSGSVKPTGTVIFLNGTTQLGQATLDAKGNASFTTSTLAAGSYSVVAQYSGDTVFLAANSAYTPLTIVTAVPDYTVTAAPSSLTVTSGTSGTATFTVTPANGYANSVSFKCGTLPSYATCTFAPAQLTFTSATQTAQATTLTFGTTQGQAALAPFWKGKRSEVMLALLLPLAMLGFSRKRRRLFRVGTLLSLALSATMLAAMSGCAGRGSAAVPATTPAGTYTVPITITDGTTAHSIQYSVTVK